MTVLEKKFLSAKLHVNSSFVQDCITSPNSGKFYPS